MSSTSKTLTFLAASAVFLANGCIPSLHPIYSEQDVVVRDQIVGRWSSDSDSQTWEFTKSDDNAYRLVYADNEGREARFIVRLTEIKEDLFMDLYPLVASETKSGFYNLHRVSAHTFYRIQLKQDSLSLSFLNPQWLKQLQKEHPDQLSHTRQDNSVLLTAETPALRRFVAKHLDTQGAFTNPFVLKRVAS